MPEAVKHKLPTSFFAIASIFILLQQASAQIPAHSGNATGTLSNPINRTLSILKDANVQKDLEIVEEQLDQMKAVRTEMFEKMNLMALEFRVDNANLAGEELEAARVEFREIIKEQTAVYETKSREVLLPHQQQRLDQMIVRKTIQQLGPSRALLESNGNSNIANLLGLTDEQKEKLKVASDAAKKKLIEKIEKAKSEALEEVLSVLDSSQRKKLEALMGGTLVSKNSANKNIEKTSSQFKN